MSYLTFIFIKVKTIKGKLNKSTYYITSIIVTCVILLINIPTDKLKK